MGLKQEEDYFSQLFVGVAPGTSRGACLSSLFTFFAYLVHQASNEHSPLHGWTALRSSRLVMEQLFFFFFLPSSFSLAFHLLNSCCCWDVPGKCQAWFMIHEKVQIGILPLYIVNENLRMKEEMIPW